MILKKCILFVFVVMTFAFTNRDSAVKSTSVIITNKSSLLIRGTSNVNTFSCSYDINKLKNPIPVIYQVLDNKMKFNKTALILENVCFDCGGNAINNDFKKILKSDKHPQLFLYLKEINLSENKAENQFLSDVQALIDIEIAGITKSYKIPVKINNLNDMLITGDLSLSLADYNLETPKKLFGLITVHDKIQIFFQLAVQEN